MCLGGSSVSRRIILFALVWVTHALLPLYAFAFDPRLVITPAEHETTETLKSSSLLLNLATEELPTGQEVLAAAQADYARLVGSLYDAGYFGPQISIRINGIEAARIPAIRAPAIVNSAEIQIDPGPKFIFGSTRVGPLADGTQLPEGFEAGSDASTSVIRATADAAREGWRDLGHAKAEIGEQSITAQHRANALDVALTVKPGPVLVFGDLVITGETAVREERIRAIAGLPTGQRFSPEELDRSRNRLQRTGTFRSAALFEADEVVNGTLPIEARITDRLPRTFGFGAELSSEDGLTLSGYWQHRNWLGGAERLRFDTEISGIGAGANGVDVTFALRFDKPAVRGPDVDLYALAQADKLDERHFSANRLVFEVGLVNQKPRNYTYSYGVGLVFAEATDAFGDRNYALLTFPGVATYDDRDNPVDAKTGYFAELSLTPFLATSESAHGIRSTLDLRGYRPLGDRVTLAFRGHVGSLIGPALDETPVDFAFYAGGGGSVRGFGYQAIGVELANGDIAGGRSFVTLSTELRIQTGTSFSVVGFLDAGYVGSEVFPDGSSGDWHTGAGFGVRYNTGVGPIRFDIATPISGPNDPTGLEFYIGIGQAF